MKPFVHLHTHSQYSLLNGAMGLGSMLKRVKSLGMDTVALTDEHNMFGAVDFQLKAKKAELKPIFGLEIRLADARSNPQPEDDGRIILLAKNRDG